MTLQVCKCVKFVCVCRCRVCVSVCVDAERCCGLSVCLHLRVDMLCGYVCVYVCVCVCV
jgi:hypothetical protein